MRNTSKISVSRGAAKVVELRRQPDTRDRVLQVAQALFAERGYRGTSLRDIAKRIGIKAPSLLHHFPSKQQLYIAVIEKMFENLEDAANAVAWGRESRLGEAVAGGVDPVIQIHDPEPAGASVGPQAHVECRHASTGPDK